MRDPLQRFKVWPTNADRPAFSTVVEAGSLRAVIQKYPGLRGRVKRRSPSLAEAYAFFARKIEGFLKAIADDDSPQLPTSRIDALFETFRQYLNIVNIELEAGDDPQVIFESLNGRGVPLLPSDLVRNFIFMRASTTTSDLDTLYGRYWRPYDEWRLDPSKEDGPWWKEVERQGRLKRPRLDLFLFHYLQYRLEEEVNIGHLFQEFRLWWDRPGGEAAPQSLGEMQRYAEAFASWLEPTSPSRTAEFAKRLKALDTSTVYPLMFFLLVEQDGVLPPAELNGIIVDLESYLVRRAVCGLSNKQYNRFFVALLRRLKQGSDVSRKSVRLQLTAGKGDSVRWPNDEEFGRAFVHRPVYKALRREVTLSMLSALEHELVTSKHEDVRIAGKLSIEHVMPQDWEKYWPLPVDSDDARERRERLIQTFGNLTLVTPNFNTAVSNRSFDRKRREFKEIARLLLTRSFEDLEEWDEKAIVARGKQLFDVACRCWPHAYPQVASQLALDLPPDRHWGSADDEEPLDTEPPIDLPTAASLLDEYVAARRLSGQHPGLAKDGDA